MKHLLSKINGQATLKEQIQTFLKILIFPRLGQPKRWPNLKELFGKKYLNLMIHKEL